MPKKVRGYKRKDGVRVRAYKRKALKSAKAGLFRERLRTMQQQRHSIRLDRFKRTGLHQGIAKEWRF